MRRAGILALLLLLVGGCGFSGGPRRDETDRIARIVSDAISYPRQPDAAGYARAARATMAARSEGLSVVAMRDFRPAHDGDPMARLVYRIHLQPVNQGFDTSPEVTRCYQADFSRYGIMSDSPTVTTCPTSTAWVSIPPAPLVPQIPPGADERIQQVLRDRSTTDVAILRRRLVAAVRPAPGTVAPAIAVGSRPGEIGVSLHGEDQCLLVLRTAKAIQIWHLAPPQAEPGEIPCTPVSALGGEGIHPPH